MSSLSDFEDNLINVMKDYENLFDSNHTSFYDRQVSINSWEEIAGKVKSTVQNCEATWKRLKGRFSKNRKEYRKKYPTGSGRKAVKEKEFTVYHAMSFLDKFVKER